jgi:hypothetical protein
MRPNERSRAGLYGGGACCYGAGVGRSAAATAPGGMHGFPAALTSFIGRAGAVREVAGLLEEYRLVTVTEPGGVGKTRLAGQVARQVAGRFADGAWLAELAAVRDPAQVAAVVAAALGIPEQPGVPAEQVLAGQQLLLVLDNCEHVIGAVALLCAGLLAACDDVRVLATSREPLAVSARARTCPAAVMISPGLAARAACSSAAASACCRAAQRTRTGRTGSRSRVRASIRDLRCRWALPWTVSAGPTRQGATQNAHRLGSSTAHWARSR